jgi:hypothetical protein
MGPGDHKCHAGQSRICTAKPRDKYDRIIVQEKLDGSNVGVAKVDGRIVALSRAGYEASTSPYSQHHRFAEWVAERAFLFNEVLLEGERIVGEWLLQAHGTRYKLSHEPFVAFDIMTGLKRLPYPEFCEKVGDRFTIPHLISSGPPMSIEAAMAALGERGFHGAQDPVEGAVWRVERNELIAPNRGGERRWVVDFLAKYVRKDKVDGAYLCSVTGQPEVWNETLPA